MTDAGALYRIAVCKGRDPLSAFMCIVSFVGSLSTSNLTTGRK